MEFAGNKYSIKNGKILIQSVEHTKSLPQFVGKFFSVSGNEKDEIDLRISSLTKGQIYATEIDRLNDISEGLQLQSIAYHFLEGENPTSKITRIVDTLKVHFGVISLTSSPYKIPMWGLYTDNSGIYVEYHQERFISSLKSNCHTVQFSNLFPVRYLDNFKQFAQELYELTVPKIEYKLFPALQSKLSEWNFEEEHRVLLFNPGGDVTKVFKTCLRRWDPTMTLGEISRLIDYDISSIRRIVLAFNFFNFEIQDYSRKDNSEFIRCFSVSKHQLGRSKTTLLEFCLLNNIPVFKLDMTIEGPETFLLEIKDEGDKFALEYNTSIPYTKDKDFT